MRQCKIYESLDTVENHQRVVIIGNFDGVHMGHQKLIQMGYEQGKKLDLPIMVLTFYPQFQTYVNPDFSYIMSKDEKLRQICDMGVDEILCIPCDKEFSSLPKDTFIHDVLKGALKTAFVIVGYDFSFGAGGEGNPDDLLEAFGEEGTMILSPVCLEGVAISSSKIREALKAGDIELANTYLSRPFSISGEVVHGLKNGRKLLFPTANIHLENQRLIPARGVYVAEVVLEDGTKYPGVLNIGTRPTVVDSGQELLEVHLLDYEGDLYGENITVYFKHFLRPVKKYSSIAELKDAIQENIQETRTYFNILNGMSS